jgi:hypothetical protein
MHYINLLADQDLPDNRQRVEEAEEGHVTLADWNLRQVIHLKSVGHRPDSTPYVLELVGEEGNFVTSLDQTLGQLVAVGLDSPELWE